MKLTNGSAKLLARLIAEADYESSDSSMLEALTDFNSNERGNLTDLKKKGFLETVEDDGGFFWVIFKDPAKPLYDAIKG